MRDQKQNSCQINLFINFCTKQTKSEKHFYFRKQTQQNQKQKTTQKSIKSDWKLWI